MSYKIRPGVVLTNICGASILVPNREASEFCPGVMRLTLLWTIAWKALQQGESSEKICHALSVLSNKSEEEAKVKLDEFLAKMTEKGFLIREEV